MTVSPVIRRIELSTFTIQIPNIGTDPSGAGVRFAPGPGDPQLRMAVKIYADDGLVGEYIPPRGRAAVVVAACNFLAHRLIGKPALHREQHYRSMRLATKHVGEVGIGPLDVALWDLAGKCHQQPIYRLLGGYRERLPSYASTLQGDTEPNGLSDVKAYADFAEQCLELGYPAYKMHGWSEGDPTRESDMIQAVCDQVGDRMQIMYDSSCHLKTFHDAVRVGQVCDDNELLWFEDPYADGGVSQFGNRSLKGFVRTPIMVGEHVHTPEASTELLMSGATDFARPDPDYDCGITGCLKIANAAETLGMDTEVHSCGPAMRHLMAAIPKSSFYEVNLLHPKMPNGWSLPVYTCGYSDDIDCIDKDGTVGVPQGPGLGVSYDWEHVKRHQVDHVVIE
ncbi:MAG: enolase C-terminal domain-like protein [Burkholderiaceae bacterium]